MCKFSIHLGGKSCRLRHNKQNNDDDDDNSNNNVCSAHDLHITQVAAEPRRARSCRRQKILCCVPNAQNVPRNRCNKKPEQPEQALRLDALPDHSSKFCWLILGQIAKRHRAIAYDVIMKRRRGAPAIDRFVSVSSSSFANSHKI